MSQRFSDAELACEWWRLETDLAAISEYNCTHDDAWTNVDHGDYHRHQEIQDTFHRFATHPHAHPENQ